MAHVAVIKQRKPMARGNGFKRAELPKRQPTRLKPASEASRAVMRRVRAETAQPVEKFAYVRDKRLRAMCQAMPCQGCGGNGADWAHSNQAIHGKGRSVKASDLYIAALCWPCHSEIDQGAGMTKAQRVEAWDRAHFLTWMGAATRSLIPSGVNPPAGIVDELRLLVEENE